ncbi:MAG: hypothetical protein QOJ39_1250 [Candidatus Eremiobacteraeota bacterium]|jgi:hypothetical protein|nr:hypothetical protein [Candidatus Eremiobacteraeota bacterium]
MMRAWARAHALAHDPRAAALVVFAGVLVAALAWWPTVHPGSGLLDFRVFWCGGRAALDGGNPYLYEPLHACEQRYGTAFLTASPNLVMPFVLAPYEIPVFAALARLPLQLAGQLFVALDLLALAAGVVLVSASARVPLALCAAALCMSVGLPSLTLGQLAPLELCALGLTGFVLSRQRDGWAGACAVLTLLQPHVGAFVVVAVAVLVPRARLALALGVAALAAVTAAMTNAAPASYLGVLGQHAVAEAHSAAQYSLTYLLAYFGTPAGIAVRLGELSTLVALIAAILLSSGALRRGLRSAVVYVPAACAVLGGTFLHVTQIALAVPAALLLFRHGANRPARALGAAGVVLLAIPWPYPVMQKQALAAALLVLAVTAWYVFGARLRLVVAVVAVCWLVLIPIENRPPPAERTAILQPARATELASVSWAAAMEQTAAPARRDLLVKLPTWLGLIAVLGAALLTAGRRGDESM